MLKTSRVNLIQTILNKQGHLSEDVYACLKLDWKDLKTSCKLHKAKLPAIIWYNNTPLVRVNDFVNGEYVFVDNSLFYSVNPSDLYKNKYGGIFTIKDGYLYAKPYDNTPFSADTLSVTAVLKDFPVEEMCDYKPCEYYGEYKFYFPEELTEMLISTVLKELLINKRQDITNNTQEED